MAAGIDILERSSPECASAGDETDTTVGTRGGIGQRHQNRNYRAALRRLRNALVSSIIRTFMSRVQQHFYYCEISTICDPSRYLLPEEMETNSWCLDRSHFWIIAAHESMEDLNRERLIFLCIGISTLFRFAKFKGKRMNKMLYRCS